MSILWPRGLCFSIRECFIVYLGCSTVSLDQKLMVLDSTRTRYMRVFSRVSSGLQLQAFFKPNVFRSILFAEVSSHSCFSGLSALSIRPPSQTSAPASTNKSLTQLSVMMETAVLTHPVYNAMNTRTTVHPANRWSEGY